MENILDNIRNELRPSYIQIKESDILVRNINIELRNNNIEAKCVKGGSTAKGTFLKDDHDIDLFVIFDYKYKGKDISEILKEILIDVDIVHGSRDYFQLK